MTVPSHTASARPRPRWAWRWPALTLLGAGVVPALVIAWLIRVPNSEYAGLAYAVDANTLAVWLGCSLLVGVVSAAGALMAPALGLALRWQLAIAAIAGVVATVVSLATPSLGSWGAALSVGVIAANAIVVAVVSSVAVRLVGRRRDFTGQAPDA